MPYKKKEERTIERGSFHREKEKSHALALWKLKSPCYYNLLLYIE
jgi:hypothetical protein